MISLKLADLANIIMGQSPPGEEVNSFVNGLPLLNGPAEFTAEYPIPVQYTTEAKRIAKKGDILFCVRGSTTGRMNWADQDYAIGRGLASITHKAGREYNFYLRYLIESNLKNILQATSGSTFPNLTSDMLADFPLRVPEQITQLQISRFIGNLDLKISLNNRINAELEAMAKTIYDYWFVQFDFPISKEQAKAMGKPKLEGKPYKASGGKMVWSEELKRDVPEGWEVKSLFDVCSVQYGFPFSTNYFNEEGKGMPVIRIRDIQNNSVKLFSTENGIDDKYLIKEGDVLIGMDGNFHINYWSGDKCYLNQRVVKLSQTILPNIFLKHQIKPYIKLREQSVSRTTVGHLSDKDLKAIRVLIPSTEVLNKVKPLLDDCLTKIVSSRNENKELSKLRDWLLPMLMNGQVMIKQVVQRKVVDITKKKGDLKPESVYNYQAQVFALIAEVSKQNKIKHGEMTIAKYAYLIDKIMGIPTFFEYGRHHLGPWAKEMKPVLLNKKNFKIDDEGVSVVNRDLLKGNPYEKQIKDAILELTTIITGYKSNERSHQTELLATVCKVIEDIKSTDLKQVRESMKNWPIELKTSKFKNKAEKFSEEETLQCIEMILHHSWNKFLI